MVNEYDNHWYTTVIILEGKSKARYHWNGTVIFFCLSLDSHCPSLEQFWHRQSPRDMPQLHPIWTWKLFELRECFCRVLGDRRENVPNQMRNTLPLFFHNFVCHCTAISLFRKWAVWRIYKRQFGFNGSVKGI